jgi:hypothetical protein
MSGLGANVSRSFLQRERPVMADGCSLRQSQTIILEVIHIAPKPKMMW